MSSEILKKIADPQCTSYVTEYIHALYIQTTSVLHNPNFKNRLSFFKEDDLLGKSWYTLREELKTMDESDPHPLPVYARLGLSFAIKALFGLWIEEHRDTHYSHLPPNITKQQIDDTHHDFMPYKNYIQTQLESKDYDIRNSIGYLIQELNRQATLTFIKVMPENPNQIIDNMNEFKIGANLAWQKWRSLSTLA